ncbi:hypothetical protein Syun_000061 [Stephania yunnanensis]|uniref:Cytochrome P450 n=1 Tax=Stephania yunnanensis TaxID=152371 RepID=A0AAP0Q9G7_9MAGN
MMKYSATLLLQHDVHKISPIFNLLMCLLVLSLATNFVWLLRNNTRSSHNSKSKSKSKSKSSSSSSPTTLPPGPAPWPIVGSLPEMVRIKGSRSQWVSMFAEATDAGIACVRLGNVHVIAVSSPDIAREFLKTHDAAMASRPITMANQYTSRGFLSVFSAPMGPQWRKMRRVMASNVLKSTTLQWLLNKRLEEADNLVSYVYNQCRNNSGGDDFMRMSTVVNVRDVAWQYSGNVIRKMMFNRRYFGDGRKDGGPGFEEEQHVEAARTILSLINAFCVSDYMPCLRWLDLDGHEKWMKQAIRTLNEYHDPIIDERIDGWRSTKDEIISSTRKPCDLLDVFISLMDDDGKPILSVEEIKAEVTELVLAAIDNPSNAVEWALFEMVREPKILKRAVDEIDRVVGKHRLVRESDLSQLNYILACAREAFRLHPIATFNLPHVSLSDVTVSGYFIPKGSHVLLSRVGLGRNPRVWDEPLQFRPDRHLSDGSCQTVHLAEPDLRFISFSTGRRGCPGLELGTEMTVMLLARLLQGFNWSLPPITPNVDQSSYKISNSRPLILQVEPRLAAHVYPSKEPKFTN